MSSPPRRARTSPAPSASCGLEPTLSSVSRIGCATSRNRCPMRSAPSGSAGTAAGVFGDQRLYDYRNYPPRAVQGTRREGAQPRRAVHVGCLGQRLRKGRVRPAARDRGFGGPGGVDQHRRLCQGLRDLARLGLVRTQHQSPGNATADRDHRVHQRGPGCGAGVGQSRRGPDAVLRRVLGRVLHLCLVQLPQVRPDAAVQPARAGRRHTRGQGALDRGSLGPRDGRGLAHALRHLRDGRHAAVPERTGDRPASVGAQRSAGHARRGPAPAGADRGVAPHAAVDPHSRPGCARDAVPLRGGPRCVRPPRVPSPINRPWASSSFGEPCRRQISCRSCRSSTSGR